MIDFASLGLAEPILEALAEEGYQSPTPIQAQAIPAVLAGSDVLGIAQTGTGKTAAFALPIIHRLTSERKAPMRKGCRVLVLSPTRELATQIGEAFRTYARHARLTVAVVFGGVAMGAQVRALGPGVDVLVATPGRLLDHVSSGDAVLSGTEIFVLDEADQMLDLGFVKPIRQIVARLSQRRQNLFFSATMPTEIAGLAHDLLDKPVKVSITPAATTVERIAQRVIHIEAPRKKPLLAELLAGEDMSRTLVFTRTKRGADRVARFLEAAGITAAAIHGNKSQSQREQALAAFKAARVRVMVATDIAARGIDIDAVSHVVNYELPHVPESYVHRIGRTARAGASGSAISLCDREELPLLKDIERTIRKQIPSEDRRGDEALAAELTRVSMLEGTREVQRSNGAHRSGGDRGRGGEGASRRGGEARGRAEGRGEHRSGGGRGRHRGAQEPRGERHVGAGQREERPRDGAAAADRRDGRRAHEPRGERAVRGDSENAHRQDSRGDSRRTTSKADREMRSSANRDAGDGRERRDRSEGRSSRGDNAAAHRQAPDRRDQRGPRHDEAARDISTVAFLASPSRRSGHGAASDRGVHGSKAHDGSRHDGSRHEGGRHEGGRGHARPAHSSDRDGRREGGGGRGEGRGSAAGHRGKPRRQRERTMA